jgi:hypothetical protein
MAVAFPVATTIAQLATPAAMSVVFQRMTGYRPGKPCDVPPASAATATDTKAVAHQPDLLSFTRRKARKRQTAASR